MNQVYIIKNCYMGIRYFSNKKRFEKQWKICKKEYDDFMKEGGAKPLEVWFSDINTTLKKIHQYP